MAAGYTAGDLEPGLSGSVSDGTTPVALTAATAVTAHIRRADGTVLTRAVTLTAQGTTPGGWSLQWLTGDLAVAGGYVAEIEVTWPGNRPQTFGPASFQVGREIPSGPVTLPESPPGSGLYTGALVENPPGSGLFDTPIGA